MTHSTKAVLLIAVVALAACSNASRFGQGGPGGGAGAGAGFGSGAASDPSSPAYFQQTVGDRVFFAVDQSALTPEARQVLDGQVAWMADNPEYQAIIEGHADERGTREYNLALGARRANSVVEYLVSRGVAENRLRLVSLGKERPVALCSNESCYSQNRRAVTVLQVNGGPTG